MAAVFLNGPGWSWSEDEQRYQTLNYRPAGARLSPFGCYSPSLETQRTASLHELPNAFSPQGGSSFAWMEWVEEQKGHRTLDDLLGISNYNYQIQSSPIAAPSFYGGFKQSLPDYSEEAEDRSSMASPAVRSYSEVVVLDDNDEVREDQVPVGPTLWMSEVAELFLAKSSLLPCFGYVPMARVSRNYAERRVLSCQLDCSLAKGTIVSHGGMAMARRALHKKFRSPLPREILIRRRDPSTHPALRRCVRTPLRKTYCALRGKRYSQPMKTYKQGSHLLPVGIVGGTTWRRATRDSENFLDWWDRKRNLSV